MSKKPKIGGQLSKFQSFKMERIHRSELKNAPYNPRVISDDARVKLKAIVKAHGMVSPVVWNRNTGHIVGGHQRIDIIDSLERTDDYFLDVAVIEVSLKQEKELNLALNNTAAQGDWNPESMLDMAKEAASGDIDLAAAGMEKIDLEMILADVEGADTIFSREKASPAANRVLKALEDINEDAADSRRKRRNKEQPALVGKPSEEMVKRIKENREKWKGKRDDKDDTEYYLVVVFEDRKEKEEFLDKIDVASTERYISGSLLRKKIL